MESFDGYMNEYKTQVRKGLINQAYKGLMEYMMELKSYFQKKYPEFFVSGSLYYGYMDMTYFSFFPKSLKERNLKIAIVFLHEAFRFEVWLSGYNKKVQQEYWKLIKDSGWKKYRLVPTIQGFDSILENNLVDNPDFGDLGKLTDQIEKGTLTFVNDIEAVLAMR